MRYVISFFSTISIFAIAGSLLYFYFAETLIVTVCIIGAAIIFSISWAFGKHSLGKVADPIKEKYKMSTVLSKDFGSHPNVEDAARRNGNDIRTVRHLVDIRSEAYRRMGFIEALPEWIVTQALPFLAISAPRWIIAIIIGILVLWFHEDIIPHRKAETVQLSPNEVTLRVKVSGDIQKGEDMLDPTIDVSDYCMRAHSNSNVIVLSNDGCN